MRRIVTAFATTVTALVLLFSYHTSTGGSGTTTATVVRPVTPVAAATDGAAPSAAAATYTGGVAQTQWGPVQVAITVAGDRITVADAVLVPTGNQRDNEINAAAVPILNKEVVTAQSARIDTVSGATVTSDGYLASLQSAIDQAHR